jgi:nucleoside-diphosphate-sugar epimerase
MTSNGTKFRIVITGAAGCIGNLLHSYLSNLPMYDLVLIDRANHGGADVHSADLSQYHAEWTNLFAGADTVIHLAGDRSPAASWESVFKNNIEATLNVFRAAAKHNISRVIFASSVQTMEGYRYGHGPIAADAPARPTTFYAASKLMGETLAQHFSREHGLSVICLRLGDVQASPGPPSRELFAWRLTQWLSVEDLCQAVEKAILAEDIQFAILPLFSDNAGLRWDLAETRQVLGYVPAGSAARRRRPPWLLIRAMLGFLHKRFLDPAWRYYWD